MAQKHKKWEEWLTLSGETLSVVSYADYFAKRPLFSSLQVKNTCEVAAENLVLTIENNNGMLLPFEKAFEHIPFESTVKIELDNLLSPLYFASAEDIREEVVTATLKKDKKIVATASWTVTTLPFDFWQGTSGDVEQLAAFVRPRLGDCMKVRDEIAEQLKKWKTAGELQGYTGNDKNAVRHILAALFSTLRRNSIVRKNADISMPVELGAGVKILSQHVASAPELALFACACLESMGLSPVLLLGGEEITCGVWLYDNCFLDTVSDDTARLSAYVEDGINNLAFFDVEDVFADKNASYSTSESHVKEKLKAGVYERYVDIRRCRISHVLPLPLRARKLKGYEILTEENTAPDAAPTQLKTARNLRIEETQGKDKQWQRRLLDLSMKNGLLHFQAAKAGLHVLSVDADETLQAFSTAQELRMMGASREVLAIARKNVKFGSASEAKPLKELIAIENKSGILRVYADEKDVLETASRLMRKNKEADEESGTKILYLALGFLKWYTREDGAEHYAPLVLQPVHIKKSKGGAGFSVCLVDEEFSVNTTLLEYLKQEFNIDMRGLEKAVTELRISEILAMVRMEVVGMRGWEVYDDIYLAAFSFSRYQMWYDLRQNMAEFSKNKLVKAFMENAVTFENNQPLAGEDNTRPEVTLTPLTADASQWEAIALSQTGKSFVLHGPPGTGKSQTITNMIANALNDGRRVLFVAEKQAALSVVKKRLDLLGLGDFCLELHSGKTSKADVLSRLTSTLALAGEQERVSLTEQGSKIVKLKEELAAPVAALHKKRRLGISVYEALLTCLRYKNAPELMNIESTFYDGLTKEKIIDYKNMMATAAAAAKECGGVYNSPFANVNLTQYSPAVRDGLYCAAEVVIAEIKHLKNYIGLFLELYRQKISTLTRTKLDALKTIAQTLSSGILQKYFKQDEEEFYAFFNANRRLDACLDGYCKHYKKTVDITPSEYKALKTWLETDGKNVENDKAVKGVYKKLSKLSIANVAAENHVSALTTVCDIYEAMERIKTSTNLSQYFTFAFGRVDFFDARRTFLKDLYALHDICAATFMDYNADSFNSMCIRGASGYSAPVLLGLIHSLESFTDAENSFLVAAQADKAKIPEEDVLGYYVAKASALIENVDMLAPWCMYKKTAKALTEAGLTFITDALESGVITGENVVESFEKNICKNFLQTNIPLDPVLARFSATVCEEQSESLRLTMDEFARMSRESIRNKLISRLPSGDTEGALCVELANFNRLAKSNLRGMGLRKLFEEIPELMKTVAPCMLMSPVTVSQYLAPENGLFDLVIFDEASQIPTAEAIGSLARGKAAVVVGDPKQLPPTAFFHTNYVDEDNLENEDMESVLDDCLAVNMPQRHLTWHYRSKHESLIAFSNVMYYESRLCTFPSPDALASKVKFNLVEDGVYERGFSKRNKAEGDALVAEVIRRLSDKKLQQSSMGIVTFSNVQKEYIERRLSAAIAENRLEREAYEREEPLFVKNLENVQGDERDVILFSVCYGPDTLGRISLNFGPLNQAGGWRRLNVAVSRAREEMVVFASMTGAMIDLSKTNSKGVAGLKAFLDFAEKGRTNLAISSNDLSSAKVGLGKYIAEELSSYGYDCRYDVGVSGFKIDVAVVDPKNRQNFILAILCDTPNDFTVKDRNVLQLQTLKRNNWNVLRLFSVNYYNNPKREIKKIKDLLDRLTGADKKGGAELNRAKKTYKVAALEKLEESADYVLCGDNDKEIVARLKAIVAAEEPISYEFLLRRCLSSLGITKYGVKIENRMQALIALCGFKYEKLLGKEFYRKSDKAASFEKYRVETGEPFRKYEYDYTPYELVALVKSALEDKVALYMEEIQTIVASVFRIPKPSERFLQYVNDCVTLGEERGLFVRSVSDRITLA
ncbi:MAG: DUF4011 domain-containing protein [Clostridia bacterium]|nr:DUF4011 domain-containing protein [Clostridia bacterium]